ncbi:VWA domain-containing protein [Winogradskyella sp. DF17]|uniref:VWA domain-containing protein n=1 Tax=Winogradskyella pelagia TaxID=2819984 RepID=A0ABS3T2F5_9FLAO|nr:VWA domain-containing protein [Winogradskyella sp. DF17]MBO3116926.1 VWA domain-containing protein [Winogradskyella sp. DF17]
MQTETIAYVCLAGITALLIALFQYIYKSKLRAPLKYSLFAARAITLFVIGLLLINPKFESLTLFNEKPNLVLAIDNSQSIKYLNQTKNAIDALDKLKSNPKLNERFNIETYTFGKELNLIDSITFSEGQSNIEKSLQRIGEIYKGSVTPILLLSDGNQTLGIDYSNRASKIKQPIYPIILGDSTLYADLSIKQLNVNRFAFLKNRFPVEAILNYTGKETVNSEFRIKSGDQILFKRAVQFSPSKSSVIISTDLSATKVGVKSFKAELVPMNQEKNKNNNTKNFGIEIIDQKTNIAIISERLHPDLGVLKKAIESNEQRTVSIVTPKDYITRGEDFQLIILYQPNRAFNTAIEQINKQKNNVFFITGDTTDWVYLNQIQDNFKQAVTNQTESYQASLNRNYGNFIVEDINFSNLPPLKSEFGEFGINRPHDILLYKTINGINTELIMLATFETENTKRAILNGEDIWRWRAQSYLENKSFENFDNFINKLIQYLSSTKRRNRLQIDYQSFYNGNEDIVISAQFFNKSYEFDGNSALILDLKPQAENSEVRQFPLLVTNGNYRADLTGLKPGKYNFTVRHSTESIAASGVFEVLDYNVEKQFLNADLSKLKRLGELSAGNTYFTNNIDGLINNLLGDSRYSIVQKSTKNIVPLIDIKFLLGLIALSLFLEWFVRKYHGLI